MLLLMNLSSTSNKILWKGNLARENSRNFVNKTLKIIARIDNRVRMLFFSFHPTYHFTHIERKKKLWIYVLQYSILTLQHKSWVCFLSLDSNSQIGRQLKRKPLLKPPTRNTIASSMYQHLPITSFSSAYSCLFSAGLSLNTRSIRKPDRLRSWQLFRGECQLLQNLVYFFLAQVKW